MELFKNICTILSIVGIPSLVTAYAFNRIIKHLERREKTRDQHMYLLMRMSMVGMELSEATAISYKNNRCNGEITTALEKSQKIRCEYTEFLTKQCIENIQ